MAQYFCPCSVKVWIDTIRLRTFRFFVFFKHNCFLFRFSKDLWLQYIREELGPLGQPENCGKIHWRAMKFLEGESVERFISKHALLQTGHL